ncbi:MAG: glycoside hydrolase family 78 protein [Armatimonadetes bacterium]|nr:glycoside hydrolase family 78 protein [Armatimonadota bacterium]MDW8121802.1 family 78 glycoside hydrolase catalytic domain [Armatimonadota bacterium]
MAKWSAQWIWLPEKEEKRLGGNGAGIIRNFYLRARKTFRAPKDLEQATLRITADARYVLFVNGKRVGNGPIRSWQHSWSFDTYDITPEIIAGDGNVVAVLVLQPGEANFQYPLGRGGLLAELTLQRRSGETTVIGTDRTWKLSPDPCYDRRTQRISCQQAFVEHYDATKEEPFSWTKAGYDDRNWSRAQEIGSPPAGPWKRLTPRPIPFLTMDPVPPVRIIRSRIVQQPAYRLSFDTKPYFLPGDLTSNIRGFTGLALTIVEAPAKVRFEVTGVNGVGLGARRVRLNGRDAPVVGHTVTLDLKEGANLIVFDLTGHYHDWWFTTVWKTEGTGRAPAVRFRSPLPSQTEWTAAGPFPSREDPLYQALWNASSPEEIAKHTPSEMLRAVAVEHTGSDHVFGAVVFANQIAGQPRVEELESLCQSDGGTATLSPSPRGDTEILLDFGRELVGFLDFEIEAPKGTVLDFYGFEAIHPTQDGSFEIQHTFGLNNVLRYVARDGWQSYTSIVRRGFRYLTLVVRFPQGEKRPVRIRRLRCLLNTYPYEEKGSFLCDDWKLNEIWKMCRYTLRLCSEDTYVDCPAYEQTFWVGDARNEALINYATYGGYLLSRHCWILAGQSLFRSPLVESQVPSGWQDILTAWALLWVWACEEYHTFTGDDRFLKEIYPAVATQMRNISSRFLNKDGLLEIEAWNMLDWAPMDTPRRGVVTHQNGICVESFRRAAILARRIGRLQDAEEFATQAVRLKEAINRHLWDEQRQAYVDCIHEDGRRSSTFSVQTQAMIYLCDAATEERRAIIRRYLYHPPEGFVWFGSPFALFFLMECYAKDGETGPLLDLIRREWGAMIDYGATTAWETLTPRTRSHCHAWSAAPAYFLTLYLLGIRPEPGSIGLRSLLIAPEVGDLKWAKGALPTPAGPAGVSWQREGSLFTLTVRLPEGVSGKVVLPEFVPETATVDLEVFVGEGTKPSYQDGRWRSSLSEGAAARVVARW